MNAPRDDRRRPTNVVVIMSDDQGAWSVDNPDIDAPNIAGLASGGVKFTNFFCASPVCSPARATMLTGRMPSQHGVHDWLLAGNVVGDRPAGVPVPCSELRDNSPAIAYLSNETCYTDLLVDAGYKCGLSGKWHLGDSCAPQHGHTFWRVHARGAGNYFDPEMILHGKVGPEPGYVTDIITDNAIEFLSRQTHDAPFYLGVHYTAPHSPWEREQHPAELFDSYYENSSFATFPDEPPHRWQSSRFCPRGDPDKRRELLSGYCAAITAMDSGIGRIIASLESLSLSEDTLVFFVSDNGMNMGHHGIYGKGNGTFPLNMYDTSVKVPAIAYHPDAISPRADCDALVSQYDLFPTLLDYLGVAGPDDAAAQGNRPGSSFVPLLFGDETNASDQVVSSAVYDEYGPVRMIRTDEWKLIVRSPYGPNELFHLSVDPGERENLHGDASVAAITRELNGELSEWFSCHTEMASDGIALPVTGLGQVGRIGETDWDPFVSGGAERVAELGIQSVAESGNQTLTGTTAGDCLSALGRRLHLPQGLVVQAQEARERAHRYNATTGMAVSAGQPLMLSSVAQDLPDLTPSESVAYAPAPGIAELRDMWREQILAKNPSIDPRTISRPIVVPGLTHGLSAVADLFVDSGDAVIIPELHWENYDLIFGVRHGARFHTYPLTDDRGGLNVDAIDGLMSGQPIGGKVTLLINFPNNPTGFCPTVEEISQLCGALESHARLGRRLLVVVDDAYFGLQYEPGLYVQSPAAAFASLHERILVAKVDGSTKEDLAWGLRVGFLTFLSVFLLPKHFTALEAKIVGGIRSLVSNSSRLSQTLMIRALKSPDYQRDKEAAFQVLERRYRRVREIVTKREGDSGVRVLPFNSGYFVTLDTTGVAAECLRRHLLDTHAIGTVAVGPHHLRIAYSAVDEEALPDLFDRIYQSMAVLLP